METLAIYWHVLHFLFLICLLFRSLWAVRSCACAPYIPGSRCVGAPWSIPNARQSLPLLSGLDCRPGPVPCLLQKCSCWRLEVVIGPEENCGKNSEERSKRVYMSSGLFLFVLSLFQGKESEIYKCTPKYTQCLSVCLLTVRESTAGFLWEHLFSEHCYTPTGSANMRSRGS